MPLCRKCHPRTWLRSREHLETQLFQWKNDFQVRGKKTKRDVMAYGSYAERPAANLREHSHGERLGETLDLDSRKQNISHITCQELNKEGTRVTWHEPREFDKTCTTGAFIFCLSIRGRALSSKKTHRQSHTHTQTQRQEGDREKEREFEEKWDASKYNLWGIARIVRSFICYMSTQSFFSEGLSWPSKITQDLEIS